ncbi:MAG: redoxin domain-containing protein, partial [Dehalococcoidia bacterium]|nr:redoxin domain-containing protein [Dehalococcoidia bacterium]
MADGTTPTEEPVENPAPEFPAGLTWFNVSEPLSFAKLRGKIVLLDFWTQGCINCQHIIPDLERLEEEFADSLVVIGVHTGKYSEEQKDSAVAEAIARYQRKHPVVNDPDYVVWRQWGVQAWPTVVLIDPRG